MGETGEEVDSGAFIQRKETPLGLAKVCFYSVILFTVPGIRTPQRGIQNPRLSLHGETPDHGALFGGSFWGIIFNLISYPDLTLFYLRRSWYDIIFDPVSNATS